jgi:lactam utilization protein B
MAVEGGQSIALTGETLCVHSDTPHALQLLASLGRLVG